jgi:hypothetical protein
VFTAVLLKTRVLWGVTQYLLLYCYKPLDGPQCRYFLAQVVHEELLGSYSIDVRNYRGADESLARPTSLSIVFSVQGTGGSPTWPDPENMVGDQDTVSRGRPISSGLQVPGDPRQSWSG